MKSIVPSALIFASILASVLAVTLEPLPAGVPPLYKVYQVTLPKVYGCGSMNTSALYTSQSGLRINRADLLFNGYCGDTNPYFQINLAGDDFGVITNLGSIPITKISAQMTTDPKLTWQTTLPVQAGASYAFLSTKSDSRALFAVQVTEYNQESVSFLWAALQYEFISVTEGYGKFSWDATPKM